MKKWVIFLVILMCPFILCSCATLFKSKDTVIPFISNPQGAEIYINGNRMGITPMHIKLNNLKGVTVTFKKAGYEDKTYIINTKVGAVWVILDCFGGFIPVVIDAATGNWLELDTTEVNLLLEPCKN